MALWYIIARCCKLLYLRVVKLFWCWKKLKFRDWLSNRYEWSAHREYSDCNFRAACVTDWKIVFLVYSPGLTEIHHQIPIESNEICFGPYLSSHMSEVVITMYGAETCNGPKTSGCKLLLFHLHFDCIILNLKIVNRLFLLWQMYALRNSVGFIEFVVSSWSTSNLGSISD